MVLTRSGLHYTIHTPPVRRNSISGRNSISSRSSTSYLTNFIALTLYTAVIGGYFTRNMWLPYAHTHFTLI